MEGRITGSVWLFDPSGSAWSIELIQQNGDLFLHHGYNGDLRFTVLISYKSLCEKEAAFRFGYSQASSNFEKYVYMERKRGREEAASSGNKLVDGATKKMKNGLAEKKQLVPRKKIHMKSLGWMLYYEKPVFSLRNSDSPSVPFKK
ncbi:unnamed protein product [Malus baccata var. baccata]